MKKKELAERIAAIEKHLGIEKKEVELEVGKWYRCEGNDFLHEGIENKCLFFNIDGFKDFGFDYKGKWYDIADGEISDYVVRNSRLATPEEVKSALVDEAKRRGFKKGAYCSLLNHKDIPPHIIDSNCFEYFPNQNTLILGNDWSGYGIFDNGKWAEIIEQPKEETLPKEMFQNLKPHSKIWEGHKPVSILEDRVAIYVSNEREFEILMRHYKEKGWKCHDRDNKLTYSCAFEHVNNLVSYHNDFTFPSLVITEKYPENRGTNFDPLTYNLISFSKFAEEVGIEVPVFIMKSEDGVDLYAGDNSFVPQKVNCLKKIHNGIRFKSPIEIKVGTHILVNKDNSVRFSTREAAEKWIDEQNKPKSINVTLHSDTNSCKVNSEYVKIINRVGVLYLSHSDIEAIHNAIQQLKGGKNA